jgi:hypothetical protein
VFGAAGYLLQRGLPDRPAAVVAGLAASAGAAAFAVSALLLRAWAVPGARREVVDERYLMQGHPATVTREIPAGGTGEIAYEADGRRWMVPARAWDDGALASGAEVAIDRVEGAWRSWRTGRRWRRGSDQGPRPRAGDRAAGGQEAGMSDAAIFIAVFVGLMVLRVIAATVFFFFIIPEGDRCVNCDAPTLRVQRAFWHRWLPWFRPSWCMACGWHGHAAERRAHAAARHGRLAAAGQGRDQEGRVAAASRGRPTA